MKKKWREHTEPSTDRGERTLDSSLQHNIAQHSRPTEAHFIPNQQHRPLVVLTFWDTLAEKELGCLVGVVVAVVGHEVVRLSREVGGYISVEVLEYVLQAEGYACAGGDATKNNVIGSLSFTHCLCPKMVNSI